MREGATGVGETLVAAAVLLAASPVRPRLDGFLSVHVQALSVVEGRLSVGADSMYTPHMSRFYCARLHLCAMPIRD